MIVQKLYDFLCTHNVEHKKFLLAVSGGMDSMAMAHIFLQLNILFEVAHCNFQLRGHDADLDEKLVQDWCKKNNIKYSVVHFDTKEYCDANKVSIQVGARDLRYAYFNTICKEHALDIIATAHHKNDTIETFLFNIMRGTGIAGLSSIPAVNKNIVRPMLDISKKEIEHYVKENVIAYREDSSNAKNDYTRNKIRNELLPLMQQIVTNVEDRIADTIQISKEVEQLYTQQVNTQLKKIIQQKGIDIYIPIKKITKLEPLRTLLWELVKPFNYSPKQVVDILSLLTASTGKYVASKSHFCIKHRDFLILTSVQPTETEFVLIQAEDKEIETQNFALKIKQHKNIPATFENSNEVLVVDAGKIEFPLVLRKWKQADYMYPLGMTKKKKIARILIDSKMPMHEKNNCWVLESNKKIVWLCGIRMDERYKITKQTKNLLHISIHKK